MLASYSGLGINCCIAPMSAMNVFELKRSKIETFAVKNAMRQQVIEQMKVSS